MSSFSSPPIGRVAGILLALTVSLAGLTGLRAQTVTEERIQGARARADSLLPLLELLGERHWQAEEARRQRRIEESDFTVDTLMVGPFQVAAEPHHTGLAREILEDTWKAWRPLMEGSEALLTPYLFVVHYSWERRRPVMAGDSIRWIRESRRSPKARLRRSAIIQVRVVLGYSLPEEATNWVGSMPTPGGQSLTWAARDLISTPALASRECYRGDLAWCWEAVGIADTVDARSRWYTPEERRLLVQRRRRPRSGARESALWDGCVEGGLQEACDEFLRRYRLQVPLSQGTRATLLAHALELGGPGSFERFRATAPVSMRDALVNAAGVHPDTLMATWRMEVLRARPNSWAGLVRSPFSILGWLLLFAALATRSTRWRLG
jgi:hypothetical protein